jgi:PAS domain S-box-containing protein
MRIKTQFILSIMIFSVVLLIVTASVIVTNQQISQLNQKQEISANIEQGANELNTISSQYFLYQQTQQLTFWQTNITSISGNLSSLNPANSEQKTIVNNARDDLDQLNTSFTNLVSFLETAPRNVSVRVIPEFQNAWNQTVSEHQTFGVDAFQLSESLRTQAEQLRLTNIGLILALLGVFGAFLLTMYLITYSRTLKSISNLQAGIKIIGSGNLDYSIQTRKEDEISELSQAFNQMSSNLKTITASKTDLEQEIFGRKQAEIALRESEQRWATTLASIGDAVISTDTSGKIIFMNDAAEELTGWTQSEASQQPTKTVFNIINEQTRLEVENPIDRVLREGMVVGLANHTVLIRKDGAEVAIDDSGAPIKGKDGNIIGVVLVFRDITERKKAEEELLESEGRLNRSEVIAHLGSWELDLVKDKLSWSDEVYQIFGLKPQEFGATYEAFLQAVHPDDREAVDTAYSSSLREGRDTYEIEHRVVRKSTGEIRIVYEKCEHIRDESGKIIRSIGMVQDITERKMMESQIEEYSKHLESLVEERTKQLRDSERLAAIGATAGMVGHDIRNPLQAITSDVYLAKTELATISESDEKKNALDSLQEIEKNIDYINKIVADLQDFARPLNPRVEETDIKQIIDNLLAKNSLPENVKVSVKVDNSVRKVLTDSTYINRIMYNLVNNAVQAMPKGGKLTIQAYKESNDVVITVKDTGVGIPEEVKGKLFTPMFTTKSKGQGFGLAVIKRMTESLGGTVAFDSIEGKGTTFTVRLTNK